eukprot:m.7283 g.7283  ORF g.7283 m.7283 type:complete len:52 (+) comp18232_c0_seq1:37-192(+)
MQFTLEVARAKENSLVHVQYNAVHSKSLSDICYTRFLSLTLFFEGNFFDLL